ncbi:MAG: tRNA-(ms[2]io[6]A)-hydroxylase [Myxococcota bacterium]
MLHLRVQTPPQWVVAVAPVMDEVLLDHAHLEKKAASTALTLMFRYPGWPALMRPLSELAREELEHFELVLGHLERRGIRFGRQKPGVYPGRLMSVIPETEPDRLLTTLLCCAFIEARSCERMKLLAEGLEDSELAELYRTLLASEARHHRLYLDLARCVSSEEQTRTCLEAVSRHEAEVVRHLPPQARLHGGWRSGLSEA